MDEVDEFLDCLVDGVNDRAIQRRRSTSRIIRSESRQRELMLIKVRILMRLHQITEVEAMRLLEKMNGA